MNTLNIVLLISLILVFVISIMIILYLLFNGQIQLLLTKINDSENHYSLKLKNKYIIMVKLIDLIKEKLDIDSKTFTIIKNIDEEDLDDFKTEEKLNKCYREITEILFDNSKYKRYKTLKNELEDYKKNELFIISFRTFHNKYTLEYNNIIKKFPYNLIAKINKYQLKILIDGKEIENED